MKIIVSVQYNFGNRAVYPVSDDAKLLARIAGTKTLTSETLRTIKALGYEVEVQTPVLEDV